MGHQQAVKLPLEQTIPAAPSRLAVADGELEVPGHASLGGDHAVDALDRASEPAVVFGVVVLQEVGDQQGARGAVQEHHLGEDAAALEVQLIDLLGSGGRRLVAQLALEGQVFTLVEQAVLGPLGACTNRAHG